MHPRVGQDQIAGDAPGRIQEEYVDVQEACRALLLDGRAGPVFEPPREGSQACGVEESQSAYDCVEVVGRLRPAPGGRAPDTGKSQTLELRRGEESEGSGSQDGDAVSEVAAQTGGESAFQSGPIVTDALADTGSV
jgi:hypothetical protein